MATENRGRMTPEEARAVVRLWSERQWERQHWPSVADVAEGLDIPVADAEALLREVRTSPGLERPGYSRTRKSLRDSGNAVAQHSSAPEGLSPSSPAFQGRVKSVLFVFRLALGVAGLTTVFSLFLERLTA